MAVIDFANSYMTFFGAAGGNIARIQLDAGCTVVDERAGTSQTYYLIAPCRSERMYLETQLSQLPNYEFGGIFAEDVCLLLRTHWISARDNREYAVNRVRFQDVHLDVREFTKGKRLSGEAAIVEATLANRPLVGRTELHDPARGLGATLTYPIKTMNVLTDPPRFQVDTGPLVWPDFASTVAQPIERFEVAHLLYNCFDKAEFILRKPTPVPDADRPGAMTTDYSVLEIGPAVNSIWCADD
ncbi:MAG: hypothetical protein ACRDIY_11170 [Chloroflexota bacterium]